MRDRTQFILTVAAVLAMAGAVAAAGKPNPNHGKSLYKADCKVCHQKGGGAVVLTPMTKTQAQWTRAFTSGTVAACAKKVAAKSGKALTPEDLADMQAYLVAHAADSDQPETCGQ